MSMQPNKIPTANRNRNSGVLLFSTTLEILAAEVCKLSLNDLVCFLYDDARVRTRLRAFGFFTSFQLGLMNDESSRFRASTSCPPGRVESRLRWSVGVATPGVSVPDEMDPVRLD